MLHMQIKEKLSLNFKILQIEQITPTTIKIT